MHSRGRLLAMGAGLLLGLLVLHVAVGGSMPLSPLEVASQVAAGPGGDDPASLVVWQLRLPRAATAAVVGALLAVIGAAFQALFRNPLAEPYVIGVSSGAALGGTAAILLGVSGALGGLALSAAGFAGGMGALALALGLAGIQRGGPDRLLVAGVVIGSMLSAATTVILILGGQDTNQVLRWLLGSITPATWPKAGVACLFLVVVLACLATQARRLNALAMSDEAALRSGVDVAQVRNVILAAGTAGAAAAVGTAGVIPFLGLVAPHIARRWVGEDQRELVPLSALVGACLLVGADLLAQRIQLGTELPVGAVTAILGAPVLLGLLRRG
jgi:iron complex transport system permease protein